jgi:hypothetical protein
MDTTNPIPGPMRRLIAKRDGNRDRGSGRGGRRFNLHHRRMRSQGGLHVAEDLVSLGGSGTTGMHGWVHAHPAAAIRLGLIVQSHHDPLDVPVFLSVPLAARARFAWFHLNEDGTQTQIEEMLAFQQLDALGILDLETWPPDFFHPVHNPVHNYQITEG